MKPLLDMQIKKNVTIIAKIEDLTAKNVDLYVEFTGAPADTVVNKALEYVFKQDKHFQKYLETRSDVKVEPSLKVKKDVIVPKKTKLPRKQPLAIAQ